MQRVYRLLKEARERGHIPWEWIVDETRELERQPSWDDPAAYVRTVSRSYRRDFWNQQPDRVEVWSEKGTVRGVLAPVLDEYGVGFRVMHGFSSATTIYDIAQDDDGRPLIVLYVGDFDPSGMWMSEHDLPERLAQVRRGSRTVRRIALTRGAVNGLPSFPAADKKKDPRYEWFVDNFGRRCWELDAMDPNDLRTLRRTGNRGPDRAGGVGALRHRERGRAGIVADGPRCMAVRAMTARARLPNRRLAEFFTFECAGLQYTATVGRFPDGTIGEFFLNNHKSNSASDANARDAAVAASLALQFGCPLDTLQRALLRDAHGRASTPLGCALDLIARDAAP